MEVNNITTCISAHCFSVSKILVIANLLLLLNQEQRKFAEVEVVMYILPKCDNLTYIESIV